MSTNLHKTAVAIWAHGRSAPHGLFTDHPGHGKILSRTYDNCVGFGFNFENKARRAVNGGNGKPEPFSLSDRVGVRTMVLSDLRAILINDRTNFSPQSLVKPASVISRWDKADVVALRKVTLGFNVLLFSDAVSLNMARLTKNSVHLLDQQVR